MPFSLIGSDGTFVVNSKNVRGRQYPWGICQVDNTEHCDFSRLRYVLLVYECRFQISSCSSHLQELKDYTHDELYEQYRTVKLSDESQTTRSHSREMSNHDIREEVSKQVQLKEGLLKKEEEKLREMELKVQRGNMFMNSFDS